MSNEVMGLKSRHDGQAAALQSVQAQGQLQGLMLRMKLRQVYRNTTGDNLECVYTFPLAWGSVLLGMAVEIGPTLVLVAILLMGNATRAVAPWLLLLTLVVVPVWLVRRRSLPATTTSTEVVP